MFFSTSFALLYFLANISKLFSVSETILPGENNQVKTQNRARGRASNKARNLRSSGELNSKAVNSVAVVHPRKRKFKTDKYLHNGTLKTASFHIKNNKYLSKPHPCGSYYVDGWFLN
ncbi:MAG: hypothetical protein JAZ03_16555 [Candidatus Thiodiazotropha taylori]|nr:hypothetical protein [Candidatus Thiodiazotropha taylori]MCW4335540.1 hypothetical protein [Candidatus Thiodiazotropha endolucinida]